MKLLIALAKDKHVDPQVKSAQSQVDTLKNQLKQLHIKLKGQWKVNISGKQMTRAKILETEARLDEAREKLAEAKLHAKANKPKV